MILLTSDDAWTQYVRKDVVTTLGYTLADIAEVNRLVQLLLAKETQLVSHCELLDAFHAVSLDNLANRPLKQVAGSREPARAVPVIQLQQLIEGSSGHLYY